MDAEAAWADPGEPRSRGRRLDARQLRIEERLARIGEGPAGFFRDACFLVAAPDTLMMTPHVVGHALRELESALRQVLVATLGIEAGGGHIEEIRRIVRALGLPEHDPAARAWLAIPGSDTGFQSWAHRRHLGRRRVSDEFQVMWEQVQLFLDTVLEKFEAHSVRAFDLADTLADTEPTADGVRAFLDNLMKTNAVLDRFAERAKFGWITALATAGYLAEAPSADDAAAAPYDGSMRWPLTRLVARGLADDEYRDASLRAIDELASVNNSVVHLELCEIALTVDAATAARIARRASHWVRLDTAGVLSDRLVALAEHLAVGGEMDQAVAITEALLGVDSGGSVSVDNSARAADV